MTEERWLPIPWSEGWYEVSDLGRIRSWRPIGGGDRRPTEPHLMSPSSKSRLGHQMVLLKLPGRRPARLSTLVHRAVLAAFVGPCPEGHVGRHLDGDPTNNTLANLAYGTPSDNELDKVRHGTHRNAQKTHCPQGHPYDEQNTIRERGGRSRRCRECQRGRDRRRRRVRS